MDNLIAVFANRNQSMQFASMLKKMQVACKTVNTPRELSVACGISVVFPKMYFNQAVVLIKNYRFNGFVGFYRIIQNGSNKKYQAI